METQAVKKNATILQTANQGLKELEFFGGQGLPVHADALEFMLKPIAAQLDNS